MKAATAYDPDAGRRVLQCFTCDTPRPWTSREDAIAAGWAAHARTGARQWYCPACFVPAPPAPAVPPDLATPLDVISAAFGTPREQAKIRADLAALLDADPERGRAYAGSVLERIRATPNRPVANKRTKSAWMTWQREHRAKLRPPPKSPRERRREPRRVDGVDQALRE